MKTWFPNARYLPVSMTYLCSCINRSGPCICLARSRFSLSWHNFPKQVAAFFLTIPCVSPTTLTNMGTKSLYRLVPLGVRVIISLSKQQVLQNLQVSQVATSSCCLFPSPRCFLDGC